MSEPPVDDHTAPEPTGPELARAVADAAKARRQLPGREILSLLHYE